MVSNGAPLFQMILDKQDFTYFACIKGCVYCFIKNDSICQKICIMQIVSAKFEEDRVKNCHSRVRDVKN